MEFKNGIPILSNVYLNEAVALTATSTALNSLSASRAALLYPKFAGGVTLHHGFGGSMTMDTAGRLYLVPIILESDAIVNRLYVPVVATSAGNLSGGVYADAGATPAAGSLLSQATPRAPAGTSRSTALTIAQITMLGGIVYWLAVMSDTTTCTMAKMTGADAFKGDSQLSAYYAQNTDDYNSGTLAATCPSVTKSTDNSPCLYVGYV